MTDRGKRRSLSQRIGKKGETLFASWAVDRHLSTNKVDEDLGIDFFCQVLRATGAVGTEEATGAVLAVQVKATEGESRPRVLLDRIDAVDLLRQSHPTCLIGLHVKTSRVGFLFLDETLIDRLSVFLASAHQHLTIRLDEMQFDTQAFDRRLASFSKPGVQHRLAIYKAQRSIQSVAPDSTVSIHDGARDGTALVQMPWLSSAFVVDPAEREQVRVLALEQGKLPDEWPGISLRPELIPAMELADGALLLAGAIEKDVELSASWNGETATASFHMRRVGDEAAYSHEMGLCFLWSDRRYQDGSWVHELQPRLFAGAVSLGAAPDSLPFFRLLHPGAQLSRDGQAFGTVDAWGDSVSRLGPAVTAIEKVVAALNLDLGDFYLGDLRDEEFANSLGLLNDLLVNRIPVEQLVPAFVANPEMDEADADSLATELVTIEAPLVMNMKSRGVVVWVRARADMYLTLDGKWCGLRMKEQLEWSYCLYPRFAKSVHPEIWVTKHWPPIPIAPLGPGVHKVRTQRPDDFTVEAKVWPGEVDNGTLAETLDQRD